MIFGSLAETTIPKVTIGNENTVLKRQSNALSNLLPPAKETGLASQTGGVCGVVAAVLSNNIRKIAFPAKHPPFNVKKDLGAGCIVGFSSSTIKKESSKDIKHVMDNTEGFDDYWPCMKKQIEKWHRPDLKATVCQRKTLST